MTNRPSALSVLLFSNSRDEKEMVTELQILSELKSLNQTDVKIYDYPLCKTNQLVNTLSKYQTQQVGMVQFLFSEPTSEPYARFKINQSDRAQCVELPSAALRKLFQLKSAKSVKIVFLNGCNNKAVIDTLVEVVPYVLVTDMALTPDQLVQQCSTVYWLLSIGEHIEHIVSLSTSRSLQLFTKLPTLDSRGILCIKKN